jgi:hypothetical protein
MADRLSALFGAGVLPKTDFPPESRYHGSEVRSLTAPDGTGIVYLARRFVPEPERFRTLSVHVVAQGERLDLTAARLIGDPEQYWRLCDSNGTIWPEELEAPEAVVRITLPADVQGPEQGL